VANKGNYDLLLIGIGQSIYEGSFLGRILGFTTQIINPDRLINKITGKERLFENLPFDERTNLILSNSNIPVGILIDKNLSKIDQVFVPVFDVHDTFLVKYVQRFIANSTSQITILDMMGQVKSNPEMRGFLKNIELDTPENINLINEEDIEKGILQQNDLMLISLHSWKKLIDTPSSWLSETPSTLIIKPAIGRQ